jgi:hypothetical protein
VLVAPPPCNLEKEGIIMMLSQCARRPFYISPAQPRLNKGTDTQI